MNNSQPLADIVSLDRYPIGDLTTPAAEILITQCRKHLADNGLCLLPEFLATSTLVQVQVSSQSLLPDAYYTEHWRATPNGDAANAESKLASATRASISSIAYDQLDNDSALRVLYSSEQFTAFINAVIDGPELYVTADPLIGCMLSSMSDGDELGWHYDPNDVVVSLLIQQPESGGEFEFVSRVRQPHDNAIQKESQILAGNYPDVISKSLKPGTLSLFNGYQSLHRVAPVVGEQERIVALFNYAEVPYYGFSEEIHAKFFGRTVQTAPD